jgi:hypothetical protein
MSKCTRPRPRPPPSHSHSHVLPLNRVGDGEPVCTTRVVVIGVAYPNMQRHKLAVRPSVRRLTRHGAMDVLCDIEKSAVEAARAAKELRCGAWDVIVWAAACRMVFIAPIARRARRLLPPILSCPYTRQTETFRPWPWCHRHRQFRPELGELLCSFFSLSCR